jgi:branched-chain amino acid transport system substrate-binding protein
MMRKNGQNTAEKSLNGFNGFNGKKYPLSSVESVEKMLSFENSHREHRGHRGKTKVAVRSANSAVKILALLLLSVLMVGCWKGGTRPPCPLEIGVVYPKTGIYASGGQEEWWGLNLAEKEINRTGGILGCEVKLVYVDSESTSRGAQLGVKTLDAKDVPLIIGEYSSSGTILAAGVADAYEIPFLVPTASSELVTTSGYEWVFRLNATSNDYVNTTLDFVQSLQTGGALNVRTLAIIFEDTEFGQSAAVAAAKEAVRRGFKIVAYEVYQRGTTDFTELLWRVKAAQPDAVYMAANAKNEAQLLMHGARLIDFNPQLYLGNAGGFITHGFTDADDINAEAEYLIVATQWEKDVDWLGAARFTEKFIQEYQIEPPMRSATCYTTLYVAKDALERAYQQAQKSGAPLKWETADDIKQVRAAVRDMLKTTHLPNTLFGPIRFDDTGQNAHQVLLVQIINGQYVTIYPRQDQSPLPYVPVPAWGAR